MGWIFDGDAAPGWFDYFGMLVAVVGFGLTIWQTVKSRNAAEAATTALLQARKTLVSNTLLASQNQFQLVVADLDQAIRANQGELAHRTLVRYSHLAKETDTLLGDIHGQDALRQKLVASSELALDTKEKIVQAKTPPDISRLSKLVSRDINQVAVEMTSIVATLRLEINGADDV